MKQAIIAATCMDRGALDEGPALSMDVAVLMMTSNITIKTFLLYIKRC